MPNTHVPAAATGLPIPHPRLAELIQRRALRKKVERAVSVLIAVLDEIDADAEAEPSLGAAVVLHPAHDDQRHWADGVTDDREVVDDDGGDILDEPHDAEPDEENGDERDDDFSDKEPSLGAPELMCQPLAWGCLPDAGMDIEDVDGLDRLTWETSHA